MIPILAQLPDAIDLRTFLECAGFLAGLYLLVEKIKGSDRIPNPLTVEEAKRFATHEELERVEKQLAEVQAEVRKDIAGIRTTLTADHNEQMRTSAEGRSRLHKEINDIAASVHRIEGALSAQVNNRPH